jgi:hypothetical protein
MQVNPTDSDMNEIVLVKMIKLVKMMTILGDWWKLYNLFKLKEQQQDGHILKINHQL